MDEGDILKKLLAARFKLQASSVSDGTLIKKVGLLLN